MLDLDTIHSAIVSCCNCPLAFVDHAWPPISFFGDVAKATAWTVGINPSSREFTDGRSIELTGTEQRFALVRDFAGCSTRADLGPEQAPQVLEMQRTVFHRAPYRNYFNRLGRFIISMHDVDVSEPLAPFLVGPAAGEGRLPLYCHMDVVKCATRVPWSKLRDPERKLLVENCAPHLRSQLEAAAQLDAILINGKTAMEVCLPALRRFGLQSESNLLKLSTTTSRIEAGVLALDGKLLKVVAWSANVVNQQLRIDDLAILANAVRTALNSRLG